MSKLMWHVIAPVVLWTSLTASADIFSGSGWDDLVDRIGIAAVPTGDDVIVAQVEAPDASGNYTANENNAEFDGKFLIKRSGGSGVSSHANTVARRFYGLDSSIAPGVWFINCFEVNDFLLDGVLKVGQGSTPPNYDGYGNIKVWNHSWIGTFNNIGNDTNALRRQDWIIDTDDDFVCVGINNASTANALLSYSFNALSVGRRNGEHSWGTIPASYDGAGRMRPDICGPMSTTSDATASVSGAAAILVEWVRDEPDLPSEAEAAETLRAILMAGARHTGPNESIGDWSNGAPASGADRGFTTQPLDAVMGAGHVDVNRSHEIISGGWQSGGASHGEASLILQHGWSMESIDHNSSSWWTFSISEPMDSFSVVAAWNRQVASNFGSWSMADFDLELFVMADGEPVSLIGNTDAWMTGNVASASAVDNVEHLWIEGLQPGTYGLRLSRIGSEGSNDIAIAWHASDPFDAGIPGDINGDGIVSVDDLLEIIGAWGPCDGCDTDITGDGLVNVDDVLALLSLWG